MAALSLTGTPLSVIVFIGLIMLAGIVVNNAIVLIDLINQLRDEGMDKRQAILEAGRSRLRPIPQPRQSLLPEPAAQTDQAERVDRLDRSI